jgi:hypothetical protein
MDMYGDLKFTVLINSDEANLFAPDADPFLVVEEVGMLR